MPHFKMFHPTSDLFAFRFEVVYLNWKISMPNGSQNIGLIQYDISLLHDPLKVFCASRKYSTASASRKYSTARQWLTVYKLHWNPPCYGPFVSGLEFLSLPNSTELLHGLSLIQMIKTLFKCTNCTSCTAGQLLWETCAY